MRYASTLIRAACLLAPGAIALATSSCVPLLVGAAVGSAAGYIARDEGLGVAPPLNSGAPNDTPAYEDQTGGYDEPAY